MNRFTSSAVLLSAVAAVLAGTTAHAFAKPKPGKGKHQVVTTPWGTTVQQRRTVVTGREVVVAPRRPPVLVPGRPVAVERRVTVRPNYARRRVVAVYPRYRGPRRPFFVGSGIWLGFTIAAPPYCYEYPVFERYPVEVAVQIELQREGYYRGPIDGIVGPGTRQAIADFEADNGLFPDGRIDRELLYELDLVD